MQTGPSDLHYALTNHSELDQETESPPPADVPRRRPPCDILETHRCLPPPASDLDRDSLGQTTDRLPERFEFTQIQMGMTFRVVLYAPDEDSANAAASAAYARIKQLNGIMSDYDPESELMQLCRTAGTGKGGAGQPRFAGRFIAIAGTLEKIGRRVRRDGRAGCQAVAQGPPDERHFRLPTNSPPPAMPSVTVTPDRRTRPAPWNC